MTSSNRSLPLEFVTALALALAAVFFTFKSAWADETSRRVVAIGGSVTEIVFALGEQDRLVARDSTGVFPQEALALPDVGYIRALSPEGVLSVNPDLLLMLEGSGPPQAVDVIRKTGIAIADIPDDYTADGILAKVHAVGDALGVPEKAEALIGKLSEDLASAQKDVTGQAQGLRVLFILSFRDGRVMASGIETAADGIISLAGAENAIQEFTGYKQLSDEAIVSAAPDVILMMDRGGSHGATKEDLFAHPALSQTPASQSQRLIKMPGHYLLGFGPRTANAIRDLAQELSEVKG